MAVRHGSIMRGPKSFIIKQRERCLLQFLDVEMMFLGSDAMHRVALRHCGLEDPLVVVEMDFVRGNGPTNAFGLFYFVSRHPIGVAFGSG